MPLTRQQAEADAVGYFGETLLALCGLATTTGGAASPNADLTSPLYRALAYLGYAVAAPPAVTDADLAQVPATRIVRFLDYFRIMVVDVAAVRLITRPKSQEWVKYKVTYGDPAKVLAALRATLWIEYRRGLNSGAPAVGKLDRESANALDPTPYFPPYPPLGSNPLWPTPPDA